MKYRLHNVKHGLSGDGRLRTVISEGEDLMKIKWCMKAKARYFMLKSQPDQLWGLPSLLFSG
jgi:hypothetical protein